MYVCSKLWPAKSVAMTVYSMFGILAASLNGLHCRHLPRLLRFRSELFIRFLDLDPRVLGIWQSLNKCVPDPRYVTHSFETLQCITLSENLNLPDSCIYAASVAGALNDKYGMGNDATIFITD